MGQVDRPMDLERQPVDARERTERAVCALHDRHSGEGEHAGESEAEQQADDQPGADREPGTSQQRRLGHADVQRLIAWMNGIASREITYGRTEDGVAAVFALLRELQG